MEILGDQQPPVQESYLQQLLCNVTDSYIGICHQPYALLLSCNGRDHKGSNNRGLKCFESDESGGKM
jgi:hypothetical protein